MSRFGSENASRRLEQLSRVLNLPLSIRTSIRTIKSSSISSSKTIVHLIYHTADPEILHSVATVGVARGLHVIVCIKDYRKRFLLSTLPVRHWRAYDEVFTQSQGA